MIDKIDNGNPSVKKSDSAQERDDTSHARSEKRETREKMLTQTEKSLTHGERDAVTGNRRLTALTVYSIILREGEEELSRPRTSLWWSGVAAGIGISTSVLAEGVIRSGLGGEHAYLKLLESFGYTFGFVLVILSRLQLFTENTITVVLPVLADPTRKSFFLSMYLWAIVFAANMAGTFFTATIAVYGGILSEDVMSSIFAISREITELGPTETMLRGIPAGFLIAALVWMLPSAKGMEVVVIVMFTWLIAAGGFTHVIAGSNEIFNLVLNDEMPILTAFGSHIFPMLAGNVLGGTGLFAMLAYGQISQEM